MRVDDFDFELPPGAIAQEARPRGKSRLLHLPAEGALHHRSVADLPEILAPGDLVVLNDTRVIPSRLFGRAPGGGDVEVFLVEPDAGGDPARWVALTRPGKRSRPGMLISFEGLEGEVVATREDGSRVLQFSEDPRPHLPRLGHVPLPPYIARPDTAADRERYQTVYARADGAVAAPTAGLHFTPEILAALAAKGVETTTLTLHVGLGTFKPMKVAVVEEHRMDSERYEVPAAAAEAIARARARGGRVVAVGTTATRTLETVALDGGLIAPGSGRADIFITPGFAFRVVDVLLTNFHLPRSTLLLLVSAFAGRERILAAYREAIAAGYLIYSYGDAMLLERRPPG
jgi:S-adenosylmethionine:tRNA ribosyltransferase-isomerase